MGRIAHVADRHGITWRIRKNEGWKGGPPYWEIHDGPMLGDGSTTICDSIECQPEDKAADVLSSWIARNIP